MFGELSGVWLSLFCILILLAILSALMKKKRPDWKLTVQTKLQEIKSKNSDIKLKIIDLDKLLEYTFQNHFYIQQPLGHILKIKASKFQKSQLDEIWFAHKIRNHLAHNIDYSANYQESEKAVHIFYKYIHEFSA